MIERTSAELKAAFDEVVREYLSGPHEDSFVHRGYADNSHRFLAIAKELLAHLPPDGTMIDVGSGDGIVPRMIMKLGAGRIISIDSEPASGTTGVDYLTGTGIETALATVGVDPVPLPDDVADLVFAGDVIEHIPHTPRHFMAELMRLLKPGGWLVLETPNAVSLRTRLKMLAGVPNWVTLDGIWGPELNVHHHKEYILPELKSLFERAGYVSVAGYTYEQFWQKSLKKMGRLQTMGADGNTISQFGKGFNPLKPYEYARMVFLAAGKVRPNLRSSLIVAGQKPA